MKSFKYILLILLVSGGCIPGDSSKNIVDHERYDHRATVQIDSRTTIVSPESGVKLKRAMLSMQKHPDGSILLCVQTLPILYRSTDQGKTWKRLEVKLPGNSETPFIHGLGISRDGRVWLMHQTGVKGTDLFVSVSTERQGANLTWTTTPIDYASLSPNLGQPYAYSYNDYNTFFEQPDGTMSLGVGLRYRDHNNYRQKDSSRPGFHETLIRSSDGGKTWGDPTEVHQHVAETCYAVNPHDPSHVLAMTRKQRMLLHGEDAAVVTQQAGVPIDTAWPWKGAMLLESRNGGRSFREVDNSYLGYYSHRGTLLWTNSNVIVAPHTAAGPKNYGLVVNVSLNGGKTWVNGTRRGTSAMQQASDFLLHPDPPGFSFMTPTVELSPNHFLTVYCQGNPKIVKGVFWKIKTPEEKPRTLGNKRQLFIDNFLIESLDGVSKTLNQPTKYPKPIIERIPEQESTWAAGMPISFSSVVYDEGDQLFKMWYSLHTRGKGDEKSLLCYASSTNGIDWVKPDLKIFKFRGTGENNIVLPFGGLASGVFIDPQETDPSQRYKMMHMFNDYKIYASHSADGFRWKPYNQGKAVFLKPPGHDSQMVAYWDRNLGKYVAIIRDRTGRISDVRAKLVTNASANQTWKRLWDPSGKRSPQNHSIRRVGQIESDDFLSWTNYRVILGADIKDPLNQDQFYNMEVLPYEGLRIGLMTVFSDDPDYCRGSVQLTSSRDGRNWRRFENRQPFIPLSNRLGDFDWGSIYPLQAPLVVDDEIWIYYVGYGVDHNHAAPAELKGFPNAIMLAKLRLDGFVSIDAGPSEGTLTTKPLTFSGETLQINADSKQGRVLVEVLDENDKPMTGFTKNRCNPFQGDSLRHVVTWDGKSDVSPLEGKVVKLRFYLQNAKLYSFSFPGSTGDHRYTVKIDKTIEVVPPGTLTRAMMSMVRHPDQTIYLNTQTGPLYKSNDDGKTWIPQPVKFSGLPSKQVLNGIGVNRKGRLFLTHQSKETNAKDRRLYGQDLFVSYSDDDGKTWTASQTDFRKFPPGIPNMKFHEDGTRTFIEKPDGTLMFATTIVPAEKYQRKYPPARPPIPPNYQYGGTRNDTFGDVIFRSKDGGKTWGDPTRVYTDLNAHESAMAIDPKNPDRIMEIARIQRLVRPDENKQAMMVQTGNPKPYYKQAALFESVNSGRTFWLAPGAMTEWYGHRGSILWTERNIIVLTHNSGEKERFTLARISLDGGRRWVDGTRNGTGLMANSTKFKLTPPHSFATPTIELQKRNHFLTMYCVTGFGIKGVFWHLQAK